MLTYTGSLADNANNPQEQLCTGFTSAPATGWGWAWLLYMYVHKLKDDISTLQTLTDVTLQLNDKDVELHCFHGLLCHAGNVVNYNYL